MTTTHTMTNGIDGDPTHWFCELCGREFIWTDTSKTVLTVGDETVIHKGSIGMPGLDLNMTTKVEGE